MECEICQCKDSKYSCPRCNVKYCSLDCYRSKQHEQCSETFYKECVVEEMQNQGVLDRKNVTEMLQRLEDDDEEINQDWEDLDSDDEENEPEDLAVRIAGVDLNDADALWERLNDEERQEFKSIVYNDDIQKLVKEIIPWWRQTIDTQKVEDNEVTQKTYNEILKNCPKESKKIENLIAKSPHPCIVYNIANVLASYAFLYRYYNGDHENYDSEFANNFIMICDNFKSNVNFIDEQISSVIHSISNNCQNSQLPFDKSSKDLLLEDIEIFFRGPKSSGHDLIFAKLALSDLLKIFKHVKSNHHGKMLKKFENSEKTVKFSSEFPCDENSREFEFLKDKNQITNCIKKLEFYISFLKFEFCHKKYPINLKI